MSLRKTVDDVKLKPIGGSLLNGLGIGLVTMTPDRRFGIDVAQPLSTLHVGGDAHVDGYVTAARGIRIGVGSDPRGEGASGASGAFDAFDALAKRVEALESIVARLTQRS
jgi:hypothetical protein